MIKSITIIHQKMVGLSEETIKKVLMSSGLTEKEAEVYIFLAKHDPLKGGEITRLLKKDKAQVFRILKSLQAKGLVEATLEFPTRFTAVPFETVIESSIKVKQEEVDFIEKAKKDLLRYLSKKREAKLEPSLEKFVVIEGNNKIFSKIMQMVKDTKRQLSVAATISDIMRADQFGTIDAAFSHPLRREIQFRFLTEFSKQNLNDMKIITKRTLKGGFNFKARNPDLGLRLFPRMVVRDDEEILFYIRPTTDPSTAKHGELCLWTNCKSLVQAFTAVFEDLWRNSTDIQTKIMEIETGKPTSKTYVISDAQAAKKRYEETVQSAKEEIITITSSQGLIEFWKQTPLIEKLAKSRVSVKIMAPIVSGNLQAVQELSKFCIVKHVSTNYLVTTIVDGKHLFQFKEPPPEQAKVKTMEHFENTLYTDDLEFVEKTKNMLNDIWKNAYTPSTITLESILGQVGSAFAPLSYPKRNYIKKMGAFTIIDEKPPGTITEKDVLNKIMNAKKYPAENSSRIVDRMYATIGWAVIHPPDYFNLPDTMIQVHHIEKQSSLGEEDAMVVFLWLETPKGYAYVPVAIAGDNSKANAFWKTTYAGTPAGQNTRLVKKDEIQIRVHGNTLFAGWTVPIPLYPPQYILPPACILIEGYGNVKTVAYTVGLPSGYRSEQEQNYFAAFVTFLHPSSKYSGPRTDGFFIRDFVATTYPPSTTHRNNRAL